MRRSTRQAYFLCTAVTPLSLWTGMCDYGKGQTGGFQFPVVEIQSCTFTQTHTHQSASTLPHCFFFFRAVIYGDCGRESGGGWKVRTAGVEESFHRRCTCNRGEYKLLFFVCTLYSNVQCRGRGSVIFSFFFFSRPYLSPFETLRVVWLSRTHVRGARL
jgi:hypothetical protein